MDPKNKWILATKNRQNIELSEKKKEQQKTVLVFWKELQVPVTVSLSMITSEVVEKASLYSCRFQVYPLRNFTMEKCFSSRVKLSGLLEPKRLLIMFVPTIGPKLFVISFFLLCKKKKLFLWNCWHKIEETYFLPAAGTRLNWSLFSRRVILSGFLAFFRKEVLV